MIFWVGDDANNQFLVSFSLMFLEERIEACWLCSVFFGFPTLDTSQGIDSPIVLTELRLFDEGGVEALRLWPELICVYGKKVTNQVPETLKFFGKCNKPSKPTSHWWPMQATLSPSLTRRPKAECLLENCLGKPESHWKTSMQRHKMVDIDKVEFVLCAKECWTFWVPGSQSRQ